MVNKNIDKITRHVAIQSITGLISCRIPAHICLGIVTCSTLPKNSTTTTSSNDVIKANIKKITVGEVVGFNEKEGSEAVNLVCNLTGDNSKDVVSFGTEAGLFQEFGISTVVCGPG